MHLLNRKPKNDELDIPPGPHADIFTRGLTADQVGSKITAKLREYVGQLQKPESAKP